MAANGEDFTIQGKGIFGWCKHYITDGTVFCKHRICKHIIWFSPNMWIQMIFTESNAYIEVGFSPFNGLYIFYITCVIPGCPANSNVINYCTDYVILFRISFQNTARGRWHFEKMFTLPPHTPSLTPPPFLPPIQKCAKIFKPIKILKTSLLPNHPKRMFFVCKVVPATRGRVGHQQG